MQSSIQLKHSSHSYPQNWKLIFKQLFGGGWSVLTMECNYQVRLGWPLTIAYGFGFSRDSMHTSEIITQPTRRRYLSMGLTTADLKTRADTHEGVEKLLSVHHFLQSHSVSDRNGFLLNRFCL